MTDSDSTSDRPPPSTQVDATQGGHIVASRTQGTERSSARPLAGRWVGAGTLMCGALIAGSVVLPWYTDWVEGRVNPDAFAIAMDDTPETGSGLGLWGQRNADLGLASASNPLVGGSDEGSYFISFLGPGVTILMAAGLTVVGVTVATHWGGKRTLLVGLWIALVSWLAAGSTAVADAFALEMNGLGLQLWLVASVVAAVILGVEVVQMPPGHLGVGVSLIGVVCLLTLLPSQVLLYELENKRSFAVGAILGTLVLGVGIPATGAIIGVEAVRSQNRLAHAPAVATLALAALLWGLLLVVGLNSE